MGYFGSKATSGLCQALIALMPPHSVYIESHLGGGALMKRKPTGVRSIGIDRDAQALEAFACDYPVELVHGCAHAFLASFPFLGPELVYSDPPYLHATRRSARRYRFDYEEVDHVALLDLLKDLPCQVMVSGHPSALYDEMLAGWRSLAPLSDADRHRAPVCRQVFDVPEPRPLEVTEHRAHRCLCGACAAVTCQTAFNIDPRSACKIDPPERYGGGCPGSQ